MDTYKKKDSRDFDWKYQKDVRFHSSCVNALEFSHNEQMVASGGDDTRVVIWNLTDMMVRFDPEPTAVMSKRHDSNIFALEFSLDDKSIFSGGNDAQFMQQDIETKKLLFKSSSRCPSDRVYDICVHPNDVNIVAAGRGYGKVAIFDMRCPLHLLMTLKSGGGEMYSAQFNPFHTYLQAVASNSDGLLLFDIRNPSKSLCLNKRYFSSCGSLVHASWNDTGDSIMALESRGAVKIYNYEYGDVCILEDNSYANYHTVKSGCFVDDFGVVTGSDNFNIYCWDTRHATRELRKDGPYKVYHAEQSRKMLKGHRSIVNNVRYSRTSQVLISCGVEKILKLWTFDKINGSYDKPKLRKRGCYRNFRARDAENNPEDEDARTLNDFDEVIRRGHTDVDSDDDSMMSFHFDMDYDEDENDSDEDDEGAVVMVENDNPAAIIARLLAEDDSDDDDDDQDEEEHSDVLRELISAWPMRSSSSEESLAEDNPANPEEDAPAGGSSSPSRPMSSPDEEDYRYTTDEEVE